jgi:hypothetical protein
MDDAKLISLDEDSGNACIEVTLPGLGADAYGKPDGSDFVAIIEHGGLSTKSSAQKRELIQIAAAKRAELEGRVDERNEAAERNIEATTELPDTQVDEPSDSQA